MSSVKFLLWLSLLFNINIVIVVFLLLLLYWRKSSNQLVVAFIVLLLFIHNILKKTIHFTFQARTQFRVPRDG